jgi:hypothetical protein
MYGIEIVEIDAVGQTQPSCHQGSADAFRFSDGAKVNGAFAAARGFLHVWNVASKSMSGRATTSKPSTPTPAGSTPGCSASRASPPSYLDSYLGGTRQIDRDGDHLPADRRLIAAVV